MHNAVVCCVHKIETWLICVVALIGSQRAQWILRLMSKWIELRSAANSNVTVANDTDAMSMTIAVTNTMAMAMMLAIMTMVMQQYTTTTHDNEQQLCQRDPNYDFHNIGYIIFRLGSFAWNLSLGIFRLGYFAWELSLGNFRLGTCFEKVTCGVKGFCVCVCAVKGFCVSAFMCVTEFSAIGCLVIKTTSKNPSR